MDQIFDSALGTSKAEMGRDPLKNKAVTIKKKKKKGSARGLSFPLDLEKQCSWPAPVFFITIMTFISCNHGNGAASQCEVGGKQPPGSTGKVEGQASYLHSFFRNFELLSRRESHNKNSR